MTFYYHSRSNGRQSDSLFCFLTRHLLISAICLRAASAIFARLALFKVCRFDIILYAPAFLKDSLLTKLAAYLGRHCKGRHKKIPFQLRTEKGMIWE